MVLYSCKRCGWTTQIRTHFWNHLNRKRVCKAVLKSIRIEELKEEFKKNVIFKKKYKKSDPKMTPIDPKMTPNDPKMTPNDPKMTPIDPKMTPIDPKIDPKKSKKRGKNGKKGSCGKTFFFKRNFVCIFC